MLIHPPDEPGTENQEACQRYEVMQCFTVSQPKSIQEDGEGKTKGGLKVFGFSRNREVTEDKNCLLPTVSLVTILYITVAIQFAMYFLTVKKKIANI